MATMIGIVLDKTTISSLNLHKATVRNSDLKHVTLSHSIIGNSTVRNGILTNCVLRNTKLYNCKIQSNDIHKCEFYGSEILPSPCTLRTFPPEVREMIFEMALVWDGKTPPLLAALRGDNQLYCEVLETFRKTNWFRLSYGGTSMTDAALGTVRRLKIDIGNIRRSIINTPPGPITSSPDALSQTFRGRGRFVEVHIDLDETATTEVMKGWKMCERSLENLFRAILEQSPTIDKISITFTPTYKSSELAIAQQCLVVQTSRYLKVEGGTVHVDTSKLAARMVTWSGFDGKSLEWNEGTVNAEGLRI